MVREAGGRIKQVFDRRYDPGKVPAHFSVLLWMLKLIDLEMVNVVCTKNMPPNGPWFTDKGKLSD